MCVADRIKNLIIERKISKTELSKRLGVTKATISRYVNGTRKPNDDTILKLSEIFDVSVEYLTCESDIPLSTMQQNILDEIYLNLDNIVSDCNITINGEKATKDDVIKSLTLIKDIVDEIEKRKVNA